jgi:hypothetical protein
VQFYANAKLSAVTFASNFVLTISFGTDLAAATTSLTATAITPVAATTITLPNNNVSPKTTSSFAVTAGDVLVAWALVENNNTGVTVTSSPALTWTVRQDVNVVGYGRAIQSTASVATAGNMTVTFTQNAPPYVFSSGLIRFTGSTGIGASAKANAVGTGSISLTTTRANSAILYTDADWDAQVGTARTWNTTVGTPTEITYFYSSGIVTNYVGLYSNSGAIGTKTVGLTSPGSQRYGVVALEILGP